MEKIIMHIDVNNAFLSWSAIYLLNNNSKVDIRDTYAVIGGNKETRTAIVLAKSMLAKKMGVKTGETIYEAKKKCPALKVYSPNFVFYNTKSKELFNLISKYTPDIEVASIDECYIDYGKVKGLYGDEIAFAKKLQEEIYKQLGFTVNIGIANNKLCAKMASDFSKPNKIHTLYSNEITEKMYPLPISELFGVGKSTNDKLQSLGIKTIKDLANFDLGVLNKYFKKVALSLKNSAQGIDESEVISDYIDPKGIGMEITLNKDETNKDVLLDLLYSLTDTVTRRLREEKKYALTVCIIIKTFDFKRRTHQKKLSIATNVSETIFKTVKEAFLEWYNGIPIRLIGVRLTDFTDKKTTQISFFDSNIFEKDNEKVDILLDELNKKFGNNIINKASLLNKNIKTKLNKN